MDTIRVTVSGAVGKQVIPVSASVTSATRSKTLLRGIVLSPISARAYVQIRDGNASGDIKLNASTTSADTKEIVFPGRGIRFDQGMHVKVLGTNSVCYLLVD